MILISDRRTTNTDCIATARRNKMNATTATYNPFRAAAEAAFCEITSEQAQQFYALKAQKDFQNTLDGAVTVCAWAFQLAQMTYMMGIQCRQWCDELEANAQAPTSASATLLLEPVKDTPLSAPAEVGMKLLGDAIRSGLNLIAPITEEVQQMDEEIAPGALMILPPLQSGVIGQIWNPPATDMHTEVQHMATASAKTEGDLTPSLLVPGATGKRTRKPRAKAESKTSTRKSKEVKVGQ
jgi:hypothetical protein